jgi:hypothetical protein
MARTSRCFEAHFTYGVQSTPGHTGGVRHRRHYGFHKLDHPHSRVMTTAVI